MCIIIVLAGIALALVQLRRREITVRHGIHRLHRRDHDHAAARLERRIAGPLVHLLDLILEDLARGGLRRDRQNVGVGAALDLAKPGRCLLRPTYREWDIYLPRCFLTRICRGVQNLLVSIIII